MTAVPSGLAEGRAREAGELADVLVLGAGVVGVATAYALARRGLSVVLADRREGPGRGASFANGAQLSYAYSDPLGGPGLLRKLPALMLGADPLFRVRPSLDPEMVAWGLRFLRACSAAAQREGTLKTLALALESQRAMQALLERHPIAFGHAAAGKMHLYFDRAALADAEGVVALKRAAGATQAVLTRAEAVALEPALEGTPRLEGAVYSPQDEVGDPHAFCEGLVKVLTGQYGVRTAFGFDASRAAFDRDAVTLTDADGRQLRARRLVVALGPDARRFLARLGVPAPILPMKGYSITAPIGPAAPQISITDTARRLVFCRLGAGMRIAGGAELGAWDAAADRAWLARLLEAAKASLPQAADYRAVANGWAGLRPMTPDGLPVIARPHERLVVNVGHGMLGWTLAMGSAERAAALVLDGAERGAVRA